RPPNNLWMARIDLLRAERQHYARAAQQRRSRVEKQGYLAIGRHGTNRGSGKLSDATAGLPKEVLPRPSGMGDLVRRLSRDLARTVWVSATVVARQERSLSCRSHL